MAKALAADRRVSQSHGYRCRHAIGRPAHRVFQCFRDWGEHALACARETVPFAVTPSALEAELQAATFAVKAKIASSLNGVFKATP